MGQEAWVPVAYSVPGEHPNKPLASMTIQSFCTGERWDGRVALWSQLTAPKAALQKTRALANGKLNA